MDFRPGDKTEDGYLALPRSGEGPGILVLHAWWGLNRFITEVCDRLAREGFVALAPDLYDGAIASSIEEAEALKDVHNANAARARATLLDALDALQRHPAVLGDKAGVVGFSLGGSWALELSAQRPEQIAATVLFYGVGEADFTAARCAYLGHFAETDTFDSLEDAHWMASEMRAAGRDITLYEYPGVGHWFFEADRPQAYDAEAASLAWERTVAFLNSHLRV